MAAAQFCSGRIPKEPYIYTYNGNTQTLNGGNNLFKPFFGLVMLPSDGDSS